MKHVSFIVFLFFALVISQPAFAGNDWEWRHTTTIKAPLSEDLSINVNNMEWFKNDASEHYYHHVEVGIDWKVDGIIWGFYLREKESESSSGVWSWEHRPHLNATFKWNMGDIKLSDRSRLEYRIFAGDNKWRYRNFLKAVLPVKWTEYKITPYIGDEVFYDFDVDELNMNRLHLGISAKLTDSIKAGVKYTFESVKSGDNWTDKNIIWSDITFSF